jgi:hypothetical protein
MEKLVPISPRGCMEISESRRATLFDHVMALAENGTAMETSEERVNCDLKGRGPNGRSPGVPGKAYVRLTVRKIVVWERAVTESITKKTIVKGSNDAVPNYVAGGMDATEGTYVWNYTMRNCPEEELEELYKGKLGVLDDGVVMLDKTSTGQKAWLRLEKGVTICGRRMRQTHLPHVYVEWSRHKQVQDVTKRYTAPLEERELESMRLEWSYLTGRDDYMPGCYDKGMLDERNTHGTEAVASRRTGRSWGRGTPLWNRSPGIEEWGSGLCGALQNGGGGAQESHHMHPRDTRDVPGQRCVCGATEFGGSEISDSCEVQEEDPTSVEDREEMDLWIPRNSAM